MITENFKKYLAGFFDGDGCIMVEKLNNTGYTLRIKFSQSNEDWINKLQRYYCFLKKTNNSQRRDNNRIEFELRAAGKQIEPLIDDLLPYTILKYEQLLEAKKFFKLINVRDKKEEKEAIYIKLKQLKTKSSIKPYDRLCKEYIAGLFDAEGSVMLSNNNLSIGIAQKSDIIILQKIAKLYNNKNQINNYSIYFYGKNSLNFLNDVKDYCIYKSPQINAAITYINTINIELTENVKNIRKECMEILSTEKHVDFNLHNLRFKNQESHKAYLRKCFQDFSKLTYNDVLNYCKMKEIEKTNEIKKYENKIYNIVNWKEFKINPILEFCETNNQIQLYQYYRKKVSSLPLTGVVGRAIRILVKDSITNKYVGIMCLSSDVYNLGERDLYIKKTNNIKDINWKNYFLKNIMNLSCCVPLQPFGYNTTGGKLLASLAFSKEIFDYYYNKYKQPLLAIITTSINGKSIQYDRLQNLKMIGYTKGYGSVNIPDNLYQICKEYNCIWKVIPKSNRIDRFNFLKNLLTHLELSQDILKHNNKRGIYFGYLFSTKLNQKYDISELKTVNDIYILWKDRWCDRRIINLINKNCIKCKLDLYTNEKFKNCINFELPKIKEKIITDELIKEILSYKLKLFTREEVCNLLNKKYNIQLIKSDIIKIYNGKIIPKIKDKEYDELVSVKPSKKKVTDEQIYFIIDYYKNKKNFIKNKNPNYSIIVNEFFKKYNMKITKGTVSDIILGKTKPISDKNKIIQNKPDKFKLLTNEQLLNIIKMKSQSKTTQEVTNYIKENYKIYINRNFISKLWNGEDLNLSEEIKNNNIYLEMLKNTKKRTVKAKKFTEQEITFIKNFNGTFVECSKQFKEKFNKTVSTEYVSKLKKKQ